MEEVVPDANTLIYLAKADLLHILSQNHVVIGERVYKETVVAGKEKGLSDAYLLEKYIEDNFERFNRDFDRFDEEFEYFGAQGETETFLIANQRDSLAVTSDDVALKKMKRKNIEAIRTDMLLLKQFENNTIERRELETSLRDLKSVNGTTSERISFILQKSEPKRRGEQ